MPKTIQIRNVPDDVYSRLKVLATAQGKTISQYVLDVATPWPRRADIEEFLRLHRSREIEPETSDFDATAYIRRLRDAADS